MWFSSKQHSQIKRSNVPWEIKLADYYVFTLGLIISLGKDLCLQMSTTALFTAIIKNNCPTTSEWLNKEHKNIIVILVTWICSQYTKYLNEKFTTEYNFSYILKKNKNILEGNS